MFGEREFKSTVEIGKRNAETMKLVSNWCAHVRVEKTGGVGMIEAQTGLPIGHHMLQCDYAAAGGMACWDLRDSVLHFYDRHCITCTKRKPVGLPNISQIVGERDRARKQQIEAETAAKADAALAASVRQARRDALKAELSPVQSSILDDIEAFDGDRSAENANRLIESARLAPEHFSAQLTSYIFDLAEAEGWFLQTGLTILNTVEAEPRRLAMLAMSATWSVIAYDVAAEVLIDKIDLVDPGRIKSVIPSIMEVALPDFEQFIGIHEPAPKPALLQAMWKRFPAEVTDALNELLSSRRRDFVEMAGRGFTALLEVDGKAADSSARNLISMYSRAELLIDDLDERHKHLPYLSSAIVGAFKSAPDAVDKIVQDLIAGSDKASRARAFEVYSHILKIHSDLPIPVDSRAHRIAFG